MTDERFVALIPARGGSKGVPRKNLAPIAGKPLIVYTIEAAQRAQRVSRVLVTTEDGEIAAVARAHGAEVIDRPPELATDTAGGLDVVRHALEWLDRDGAAAEWFMWLQPTSPLRTRVHIDGLADALLASGAASAVSVTETEHTPFKTLLIEGGFAKPLFKREHLSANRQELPATFRANGAIWALRRADFLRTGTVWVDPILPYRMSAAESVDVDSPLDLTIVEHLLRTQQPATSP